MSVVAERLVEVEASGLEVEERWAAGEEKTFRAYDPDQVLLISPVLSEWVPEGDLAHFVSDLVETGVLDLSGIYASYEGERGFPPYDPRLMVKLLLYGYANGVMSSRKLEAATHSSALAGCPDRRIAGISGQPIWLYRANAGVPSPASWRACLAQKDRRTKALESAGISRSGERK
jgi:hypothetical protein